MIKTSSLNPDSYIGNPDLPRIPKAAPKLECFRLRLNSAHRISGTARDGIYLFDFPVELGDGYHFAVETCILSGTTAPTAASDRILNFRLLGLSSRNNFTATANPESDIFFSIVRATDTVFFTKSITHDTIGTALSDVGQIRSRQVRVAIVDPAGALSNDTGLTHWVMDILFYKKTQ